MRRGVPMFLICMAFWRVWPETKPLLVLTKGYVTFFCFCVERRGGIAWKSVTSLIAKVIVNSKTIGRVLNVGVLSDFRPDASTGLNVYHVIDYL